MSHTRGTRMSLQEVASFSRGFRSGFIGGSFKKENGKKKKKKKKKEKVGY